MTLTGTHINPQDVLRIVDKHDGKRGSIISILEDIQADYNFLPRDALRLVSVKTGHSLVDIYGVATFYRAFSLEPRGRHLISICMGTACHVRGAPRILDKFEQVLGLKAGQTTEDQQFTLTTVNCLGACALGPVLVVDGEYHRNVVTRQVGKIVDHYYKSNGQQRITDDERVFRVNVSCPKCNRSLITYDHMLDGQPMIHITAAVGRKHGWMRMSSLYGDDRMECEHEFPADSVVDFFCPRCHTRLRSAQLCSRCDAPMIPLMVRAGGIIHFCSRKGCKEHQLDLND
jgi:NADH-quinone oxidoreductase subunit E